MSLDAEGDVGKRIEAVYRSDSPRVLATLVRLLGDLDLAEEALHEAFAAAVKQWPLRGIPSNPRAWLVSAGRFKAIDSLRKKVRNDSTLVELAREHEIGPNVENPIEEATPNASNQEVADDRLRLIFLCCHPVNPIDAQIALTLREVCALTTEEIAEAYLVEVPALAKRIVRAKTRLRNNRIPYEVPWTVLPARLGIVLKVVYLLFNEGYSASSGEALVRPDLSGEAIRLGRLIVELLPEAEAIGLLALMVLQESRRSARMSKDGDLLLLDEQDRSLWDRALIGEGIGLVETALGRGGRGFYCLQAAIAAVHAEAMSPGDTDWPQIVALYDLLLKAEPSPVVALNRAVAVAMRDGPAAGIKLVEELFAEGRLSDYHLAHSVRAELYRRVGNIAEARSSYEKALYLARQGPERRFLHRQLKKLSEIAPHSVQNRDLPRL